MTVSEYYRRLRTALISIAGDGASYEAREILAFVLEDTASPLMFSVSREEMSSSAYEKAEHILARRLTHEPLEYILGFAPFYGYRFIVSADCLIPQADTEIVCEKLISHLHGGARFADICTGSGCIALTALAETKETSAVAYDISDGALAIARKNAGNFGLSDRIAIEKADVFAPDFLADAGTFDVIVSNPPYIETAVIETLSHEVQAEPHLALDGGADGLLFYRRLLDVCPAHIKKGGALLFEIGYDQKQALTKLCEEHGFHFEFYRDFGGNDRVLAVFFR